MTRTILTTGATGFIGASLSSRLLDDDYRVRGAVRVKSAALPAGIEQVVVGDIAGDTDWRRVVDGVDTVIHLAARVHVIRETAADPRAEFRRINVDGSLNLARQAAAAGVRRFVFMSTIGVNGKMTASAPFSEGDAPNPFGHYALSKRDAEEGLRGLAAKHGMQVVVIRPPMVYGANAPGNFQRLCRFIRRGIPIPVGATPNLRSFVGVDNLVDFVSVCVAHPSAGNETFLVSDDDDLSTAEFVRRVARTMQRRARLVPIPSMLLSLGSTITGKRDLARLFGSLRLDVGKARMRLGWAPRVSVDEGLRRASGHVR